MVQGVAARGLEQRRAEIAQRIREARRQRGLTQEQVAKLLGCSRIKMNRVERAQAELTVTELDLLARELKIPVADFFA